MTEPMMIEHWPNGAIHIHNRTGIVPFLYACGDSPPHYPVPAIPLDIDYWPDPMVTIHETMPVNDTDLADERYWRECWRYPDLSDTWD